MSKKEKKLGAVKIKKNAKCYVTDPENADRILEALGAKFVFKRGATEKLEVTGEQAAALKEKYPYLLVEEL